MKLSGHDIRMKEMDRNFQKAKSDYEIYKGEFDEKIKRLRGENGRSKNRRNCIPD